MGFKTKKDPGSVISYSVDWSPELNASSPVDTIASSTWAVSAGLVQDSDDNTTTSASIVASSGVAYTYGELVNTIVTDGGLTLIRRITLKVQNR